MRNANRNRLLTRIGAALAVALWACIVTAGQDVRYNFMPGTDFAKYHTYKWVSIEGGAHPNQIVDAEIKQLQFATVQTSYNWDCCGLTMEYRRYAIANVRNENLYRFVFTLANIGSFGNLRRQERLY